MLLMHGFCALNKLILGFFIIRQKIHLHVSLIYRWSGVKNLYLWFSHFSGEAKTEQILLEVSYIAESQTGLYLVTSKFTVIGVLNFQ